MNPNNKPNSASSSNLNYHSFSWNGKHDNLPTQSEDNLDESSSMASMSTNSRISKCHKCKGEAAHLDKLYTCSSCGARYHRTCHNPRIVANLTDDWNCSRCDKKAIGKDTNEKTSKNKTCDVAGCTAAVIYVFPSRPGVEPSKCFIHDRDELARQRRAQVQATPLSNPNDRHFKRKRGSSGKKVDNEKDIQPPPAKRTLIGHLEFDKKTAKNQGSKSDLSRKAQQPRPAHKSTRTRPRTPPPVFASLSQPSKSRPTHELVPTVETISTNNTFSEPLKAQDRGQTLSPEYEPPSPDYEPPPPVTLDDSPGHQIAGEIKAMQESLAQNVIRSRSDSPVYLGQFNYSPPPITKPSDTFIETSEALSSIPSTDTTNKHVIDGEIDIFLDAPGRAEYQKSPRPTFTFVDNDERDAHADASTMAAISNNIGTASSPTAVSSLPLRGTTSSQKEADLLEGKRSAPLYGDYDPQTIEYKRQLRCMAYDSTELDNFLKKQHEAQIQAEVEEEENVRPNPNELAKSQIWGHIDPRTAWPKEQPEGWYEAKRKEIDTRGGRKANFGKLLRPQILQERLSRGWKPNQNQERRTDESKVQRFFEAAFDFKDLDQYEPIMRKGEVYMREETVSDVKVKKKTRNPKVYRAENWTD